MKSKSTNMRLLAAAIVFLFCSSLNAQQTPLVPDSTKLFTPKDFSEVLTALEDMPHKEWVKVQQQLSKLYLRRSQEWLRQPRNVPSVQTGPGTDSTNKKSKTKAK